MNRSSALSQLRVSFAFLWPGHSDVISTWIYSLLSGKLKWHTKNSQDTELLMSLCWGYWLNLLSILDCEITFFAWWIQPPKQKGDLFSRCCFAALKDRSSALEEAFSPDLFSVSLTLFSPSSLWQFITQQSVIYGQERGWLPLQNQHPAGHQTASNMFHSRDLGATSSYTAMCVHVILNAEPEETKFVCAITQLPSPLQIIQMTSLQSLSLGYVRRGHCSGSHVTPRTRICPGEAQHKCFCLKTTLMVKPHTWAALFCLSDLWQLLTASPLVLSWTFLREKNPQPFKKERF